jgi:hypothetical protein
MYSFAVYLHTDDTACPEEFRETKRMNTDFSATQKSRILIYQNNLCSSIQSVLSVCKNVFLMSNWYNEKKKKQPAV